MGSNIKTLKSFMNFATDLGYNKVNYAFKKFKVFNEDRELIYLKEEELMFIYDMENSGGDFKWSRTSFVFHVLQD